MKILLYQDAVRHPLEEGYEWLYIGESFEKKSEITRTYGKGTYFAVSRLLQNIYSEKRVPFVELIESLSVINNSVEWWCTTISYMSPLSSEFYDIYCKIELLKQLSEKRVVAVIEDELLYYYLLENYNSIFIFPNDKRLKVFRRRYKAKPYLYLLLSFTRAIMFWFIFLILKFFKNQRHREYSIFKFSWIENRCFNSDGEYSDPYFEGINEFNDKIGTFTLPILNLKLLNKCIKNSNIVPLGHYLNLKDLFLCFYKSMTIRFDLKTEYSSIIESEIKNKRYGLFNSLLVFFTTKRFINSQKCLTNILLPYENQPNDKIIILAKNYSNKDIHVVAYQHTSVAYMHLNYCTTRTLLSTMPLPDRIIANSKYSYSYLRQYFGDIVQLGGSLKYKSARERVTLGDNILILLSYDFQGSLQFLNWVLENSISTRNYIIKPHPNYCQSDFTNVLGQIPDNVRFFEGNLWDVVEESDTVIHNGTTAAIECMQMGVNVYKFISEKIDFDPLLNTGVNQGVFYDDSEQIFNENLSHTGFDIMISKPNIDIWSNILK